MINPRNLQQVASAKITSYLLVSATNFGEVKLWSIKVSLKYLIKQGTLIAVLTQEKIPKWPREEIERRLVDKDNKPLNYYF